MRRDTKGNAVKLKHVKTVTKKSGSTFTYLAVPGHKLVRLPDGPKDSPEFLMAYAAALASKQSIPGGRKHTPGSIADALSIYQQSSGFLDMADSTRDQRRRHLSKIEQIWGTAKLIDLRETHIEADLLKLGTHAANNRRKTWRGFLAWAKSTKRITRDPSADIEKRAVRKSDGHLPWSSDDIRAYRNHWPIGCAQRLAMELVYWTAARASDAVRLGPGMITKDGWLTFRQQKTGGEVSIPFNRELPEFATNMQTDLDLLLQAIEASPRHMTWLVTKFGAARSQKAFSSWFAGAAAEAKITGRKSAHGLRKARAESLAEAGATAHQIAAWTGHETLSEVQRYAKAADRKRILSRPESEQNWKPSGSISGNRK